MIGKNAEAVILIPSQIEAERILILVTKCLFVIVFCTWNTCVHKYKLIHVMMVVVKAVNSIKCSSLNAASFKISE